MARFGKLDCFIGNAGIWDFMAGLETQDIDTLEDYSGIYTMLASRSDGKFITGTVTLNDGGISIGKRANGIDM